MAIIPDQKYALKGSQIEDLASRIGDNTGDIETLEAQIQALATDFSYKGSVEDYAHLPSDAATGDVYTTTDTGIIYVWDGNAWVALNKYPSVFVGTDGTSAGEEGLVPAPTAADAGKVLGADGTWVTGGPNVVQTAGTSTTDVMSQDATTNMLWRDPTTKGTIQYLTYKYPDSNHGNDNDNIYIGRNLTLRETASCTNSIVIGHNASNNGQGGRAVIVGNNGSAFGEDVVAIGYQPNTFGLLKDTGSVAVGANIGSISGGSVAIGGGSSTYGYSAPKATGGSSIAIGPSTAASARSSIAIGIYANAANQGEVNIGIPSVTDDYTAQRFGHNGSSYRTLSGVATPTNDHDATTKEYVDQNIPTTFTTNEWNALWA